MDHKNIILFGASGHAKVVIDILHKMGQYNIVGLIDENKPQGPFFAGYNILGDLNDLPTLMTTHNVNAGIISIGDNFLRYNKAKAIKKIAPAFEFINAIHPSSIIGEDVRLGLGCVVMPAAIINAATKIGHHVIINTKASVDHDCHIHNFVSIAPGATLGGMVSVGEHSAIGLGVNIIQERSIGTNTLVGAGAAVVTNIGDNVVALGVPAKTISSREFGDRSV